MRMAFLWRLQLQKQTTVNQSYNEGTLNTFMTSALQEALIL